LSTPKRQPPSDSPNDPRTETIAYAMQQANSIEWRAQARAYIEEFGSPIVAAREVFLAYAEKAEQTDLRHTVACHAGCWFCCVIPVAVTVFEAAMVYSAILTLPEEEQQVIWQRLDAHVELQSQAIEQNDGQPVAFHHRCPLLNDAGQCSVYEARPLACRSLLSRDAKRCERWFGAGEFGDPNEPFTLTNNAAILGIPHLMVLLHEGRLDHHPNYELSSALYTLRHDPQRFQDWQRGYRFAYGGFPRMAENGAITPAPDDLPMG
jgi:Fe-S-cluster containining protein